MKVKNLNLKKTNKIKSNKRHKLLKTLLILALVVLIFTGAINVWMIASTNGKIFNSNEIDFTDADCIIILGAGVREDGSPSHMLEDRLKRGIELYDLGCSDTVLMSGDHGRVEYDEVNTMKAYALDREVPVDRIFMDHAGFSTYDSLYRAKEIFGADKVIIVTQKYHLYRALAIADSLGIEAIGVPADLRTYYGQLTREAREVAARVKDFFYIVFQPEPVVLGETISFEDSGEVTNG